MSDSKAFSLNKVDVLNLGKNALLVGLAAALTFAGENVANLDLGATGVMIVPIVTLGIDTLVKWMKNNVKEEANG